MARAKKNAKPKTEKQPEKEIASAASGAGATETAAGDQEQVALDADVSPDGNLDTSAGPVLSDDGSAGEAPEGDGSAEETAAADAGAGEPADTRPGDSAGLGNAGSSDVPPAADLATSTGGGLETQVLTGDHVSGDPDLAHAEGHAGDAMAYMMIGVDLADDTVDLPETDEHDIVMTVAVNPETFEPVTDDLALWAAYRGQRAVARALGGDQDASCLSFRQCELLVELLTKSLDASQSALEMQLKLNGAPLKLGDPLSGTLLKVFRGSYVAVTEHLWREARLATPAAETAEVSIPEHERALKLVPEALGLSETAKGR